MEAELMGRCYHIMDIDNPKHLKVFPNHYIILMHYMLSMWWIHLLSGLGNYAIRVRAT